MKRIISALGLLLFAIQASGQIKVEAKFGKGIRFESNDGNYYLKFTTRIQPRWKVETDTETGKTENRARIKRARLKFDGHFITKDLRYKIEYDVVGGYVRDAVIKWRFAKHSDLWFGQTKLPGNRERIISSANMELVDRSVFNANFSLDRDIGFQFHHYFEAGKWIIRDVYALSAGNGILNNKLSKGVDITLKLEFLPFGNFTNKGDYRGADLAREKTVKIAFAFVGDYNMSSYKVRGQIGPVVADSADLLSVMADFLLKYKGFSFMAEGGVRQTPGRSPEVFDADKAPVTSYYTGFGLNFQSSYTFKSMWGVVGRAAFVRPENTSYYKAISNYTIGINKFIVGHNFKIQADITYSDILNAPNFFYGRLQVELQI